MKQYYQGSHLVTLYEAAQYPHFEPHIELITLDELTKAVFSPLTTLYIPPARKSEPDIAMLTALNMQNKKTLHKSYKLKNERDLL